MMQARFVPAIFVLFASTIPGVQAPQASFDTTAIEQALGRGGQMQGDVYKVSLPRTDLSVAAKGIRLRAVFGSEAGQRSSALTRTR
jgi:uncharacterized protein DUF1259